MDCIFCGIINNEIPSKKVYDDENVCAFLDISPRAPVHIIVVPKIHIDSADGVNQENSSYIARIFEVIPKIAAEAGITGAYRIANNCGAVAGQTVQHIHFHILGGRRMGLDMG